MHALLTSLCDAWVMDAAEENKHTIGNGDKKGTNGM